MPLIKVWIHMIWSTKRRHPYFENRQIRFQFFDHIRRNAYDKKIALDFINGWVDHVHCLFRLNATQSIGEVAHLLKGESSHWINQQNLFDEHFSWQSEYMALSVSESIVEKVRTYIKNQEQHHKKQTFEHEHNAFIAKHGIEIVHDLAPH